jgi:hypothetical protein
VRPTSRRRFLKVLAAATGGALALGGAAWSYARDRAATLYRRLAELPKEGPRGALTDHEVESLLAVTTAIVGTAAAKIDAHRYEDFFRWHAENAAGYRQLYERFVKAIDREAMDMGEATFVASGADVRGRALCKAAEVREIINRGDRAAGFWMALFDRDWLLFERYVIREILTLFARTDAWIIAGYGPHPGVPRGLDTYKKPPEEPPER